MASLDDFDRQVKTLVAKGKLSSSLLEGVVDAAMRNMASDAHLVSTLYRCHKKASAANKLTSLYLFDGIAREARSRQKKLDREGKGKGREPAPAPVAGSTTPTGSPPPDSATPATPAESGGTYATFLKKLEALLSKVVLENWENGLPEHKEKVRKVLDIWTKAGTFSSSALVRITQKLLATNTASPAPRQASPERPSLSPPPGSPPRDSTPGTSASAGGPTSIPANVLALLQASSAAPPSQAALEQKRQEDMESEVERVLREAQMGSYNALTPAAPKPSTASSALTPKLNARPAYPPPSTSTASQPPPPGAPGLSLDPSQLAILQQVAGGLGGSTPIPAHPPQQHASTSLPYQQPPQQQAQAQQYDQPSHGHGRGGDGWSSGPQHGVYGSYGGQGGPLSRPPAQPYQQHQPSGYDGLRGQTRSFDESRQQEQQGQGGYGGSGGFGGMQQQTQDRRDEPPAKRPYQPPPSMASAQSGSPPYAQQQGSPPHQQQHPQQPQQQGGRAPSFSIPPSAPEQSPAAPSASTAPPVPPPPFDPTAFDATSPASWASFVAVLRASHPYFIALGRPPTMEEVFQLCAPSAMMALGAGGGMDMGAMGAMGAMGGGGVGQAQQGPDNGDAAGQDGTVGGGESYQGGFGGY